MLFFVAIIFADAEPFDRAAERSRACGDEAGERRRHFRTKGNFASAFVLKIKKLGNDFLAGFFGKKFERFERGSVPFGESEAAGGISPTLEDKVTQGAVFRIKLAKTGK